VILAGRRINDSMGQHIARKTVQQMIHAGRNIKGARVNVLGLTFKENCADLRNSKVIDIIDELRSYGVEVFVHDPQADATEAQEEYRTHLHAWDDLPRAQALIAAVAHSEYRALRSDEIAAKVVTGGCFIDVKSGFDAVALRQAGLSVWRL
jgi:UDP-N-acetyl-D-galactosamine dehydrogenase